MLSEPHTNECKPHITKLNGGFFIDMIDMLHIVSMCVRQNILPGTEVKELGSRYIPQAENLCDALVVVLVLSTVQGFYMMLAVALLVRAGENWSFHCKINFFFSMLQL